MTEELYEMLIVEGTPTILRHHGAGFTTLARAPTGDDGRKLVAELNRLVTTLNERKTALRDELIRDVTDAIENAFPDVE